MIKAVSLTLALLLAIPALAAEDKGPPVTKDLAAIGKRLYAANCAACHGESLQGAPDWQTRGPDGLLPAPPHDASGHTWHHDDALLFKVTKYGGQSVAPAGTESGMPAFEGVLSDAKIWAVLTYIKSTWPEEIFAKQAGGMH